MIYFTSYANQKFDILNKHGIFITKEQVEDAISSPDKTTKKGRNILIRRDDLGVAYVKQDGVIKILTFYPVK